MIFGNSFQLLTLIFEIFEITENYLHIWLNLLDALVCCFCHLSNLIVYLFCLFYLFQVSNDYSDPTVFLTPPSFLVSINVHFLLIHTYTHTFWCVTADHDVTKVKISSAGSLPIEPVNQKGGSHAAKHWTSRICSKISVFHQHKALFKQCAVPTKSDNPNRGYIGSTM